jgi:hypothetical protein
MPTSTDTGRPRPPGIQPKPQRLLFREGRVYFSRDTERQFFFILTVVMAAAALAYRFGWLG